MRVFITGGAGYIGSNTAQNLINSGHHVWIFDNFSRGHKEFVSILNLPSDRVFENTLLESEAIESALRRAKPDVVIHIAAYALVGESVSQPELYWTNNVAGTINLLEAMRKCGIKNLVFSSSCSIYGNQIKATIDETCTPHPANPYAFGKFIAENLISDYGKAHNIRSISLRYFNAAGATANLGETHDPETHLIPLALRAITDPAYTLRVFGTDYDTADGTCVRDYIHVEDLAEAHNQAAEILKSDKLPKDTMIERINLGSGKGASVLEVIKLCEDITGRSVKQEYHSRRTGDPSSLVADNKRACEFLGWSPRRSLRDCIESAWKWHLKTARNN